MSPMSRNTRDAVARLVAAAFEAKLRNDGMPFLLAHFVTNRCMCSCASCLWKHNDWEDVPLDVLKRFYMEAREAGFLAAAFTGGEPFLRKDLGELVRFVKEEAGMRLLVFTTGYFLEKRMDEVLPYLDMMIVSVDSARPERHDEIRGLSGLFDRLVRGVRLARRRYPDLSLQMNTCIQVGIEDEIDELVALAKRLDVRISFDVITEFRNAGEGNHFTETSTGLALPALQAVCDHLVSLKRGGAPIVNSDRYFDYFRQGKPGYRCHHPKLVMSVDGRGFVEDCLNLERPIGNIKESSLAEIMARPRFKQLRADAEQCSSCSSPTMVDLSHLWENPGIALLGSGIHVS